MTNEPNSLPEERRKYARLRKEFVVRVIELPEGEVPSAEPDSNRVAKPEHPPAEMTGKDISLGGIAIETDRDYAVGTTLALEILLPALTKYLALLPRGDSPEESGLFRVQCRVMWSKPFGPWKYTIGLRFIQLDERKFRALSQLIAQEIEA
jgi:hypothetical protein